MVTSSDQQGDITYWLNSAGRYPLLSPECISLLSRRIQSLPDGDPKRRRLVSRLVAHNLRLVVFTVKNFMDTKSRHRWGDAETVDYLQIGVIGLTRAAELFDPSRGYAFSTYASNWIKSAIVRHSMKSLSIVSVPEAASRRAVFYKRNGYVTKGRIGKRLNEQEIRELFGSLKAAYECVSTDVSYGDSTKPLVEMLPDLKERGDFVQPKSVDAALKEAGLGSVARQVLIEAFVNNRKNSEIASMLGISTTKVKQEKRNGLEVARSQPQLFEACYTG